MREFAAYQNWVIFREYVDQGYSASTAERPQFQVMLRDAKLRLFDGLLIHKLDRLYRNVSQLLEMVTTLEKQRISLISVLERVDFSSPSGKMLLTNIGMISEFHLNNLREETIKGKHQRALCGLWNGDIPFGYCKGLCSRCDDPNGKGYCPDFGKADKTDGRHLIAHPKDSMGLEDSFEWHVAGNRSDQDIADALNERGYRSRCKLTKKLDPKQPGGSKAFGKETGRSVLQNPFYMGYVSYKGQLLKGTHPALITRKVFEASLEVRRRWHRNPARRRAKPREYLLTGIIRCSFCGFPMRGICPFKETRFYRDTAREHGGNCSRKSLQLAKDIEAEMSEILGRARLPSAWKTRIAQLSTATPERSRIDEQRRLLNSLLERLQELFVKGDLAEEDYDSRRLRIQTELRQLAAREPAPDIPPEDISPNMRYFLEHAAPDESKRIFRMMMRAVYVGKGVERIELRKPFLNLLLDKRIVAGDVSTEYTRIID